MRRRWAIGIAVVALASATVACTLDERSTAVEPSIRSADCPDEIAAVVLTDLTCGYLTVPEDRSDPGSGAIEVFFLRAKPAGEEVGEPYFSFGYELAQIPSYASIAPPGSDDQGNGPELVLMDQRGVGHSTPSLACPEVDEIAADLVAVGAPEARERFLTAIRACHERLVSDGIDLSAYTTQAAADDAEDLRRLLGVPSWNLISFGTSSRLLLELVRRHPEPVRALVMDSPQFPQVDDATSAPQAIGASLRNLAETCRSTSVCDRAYPDITGGFEKALESLRSAPRSVEIEEGGQRRTVVVDAASFLRVVRHLLSYNDARAQGLIPKLVYAADEGDVETVAAVLSRDPGMCLGYLPRCSQERSLGAFLSFTCTGQAPFTDPAAVERAASGAGFAEAYGDNPYLAACEVWDVAPADPSAHEAVRSDVPTLIMWGEYDAFSPLDPIERAPEMLSRASVVSVPYVGQDVFGTYDCLRSIRDSWLPTLDPVPDTECLATIPPPTFEF